MTTETSTEKLIKGALIHTARMERTPIEVKKFADDVVGVLSDHPHHGHFYIVYFDEKTIVNKFPNFPRPRLYFRGWNGEITDYTGRESPDLAYLIDVDFIAYQGKDWNEIEKDIQKSLVKKLPVDWDEQPTSVDWNELIN